MSHSSPISPFFHARATYAFKPNRNYRVYVTSVELIFVEAGPGGGQQFTSQMAMQGGLIGGLIGALVAKQMQKKASARAQALDESSADEIVRLADEGKNNFRSPASEIDEASFEPAGAGPIHAGRLRLRHQARGKMTLELATVDDMRTALDTLPPFLGDTLKVNVAWDEKKQRFVRKKSKARHAAQGSRASRAGIGRRS